MKKPAIKNIWKKSHFCRFKKKELPIRLCRPSLPWRQDIPIEYQKKGEKICKKGQNNVDVSSFVLEKLTGGPGKPGGPINPGGPISPYSPFSPLGPGCPYMTDRKELSGISIKCSNSSSQLHSMFEEFPFSLVRAKHKMVLLCRISVVECSSSPIFCVIFKFFSILTERKVIIQEDKVL